MAHLPTLDRALVRAPGFAERAGALAPAPALLDLPEKAVQFGTGALLRGLVDFFVDEANRRGQFGGRVVAVGSTGSGRDDQINAQDGLYTLAARGVADGRPREELRVVAALSRALSAQRDWGEVLACARNPWLQLVFSNTTEVGIALDEGDDFDARPPRSFPGKLTRFLHERARTFAFARDKGVVVVPCELVEDNGDRLREVVLALAARWELGPGFGRWVEEAVLFCNTLVDRIVPGAPAEEDAAALRETLGYEDGMLTTCEVYRLLAIQPARAARRAWTVDALRDRLGFAGADPGVLVTDDVAPYRERKVRLLNGAHTVSVPAALLCGLETVRDAVEHEQVGRFIRRALFDEIVPSVTVPGAEEFAREVLDRFANPYIRHALIDITLQGTMKMRVRVVPSILQYAARTGRAPASLALGFAAYLLYMRGDLQEERRRGGRAVPADDQGERVRALWDAPDAGSEAGLARLVRDACGDAALWGADLGRVPGFVDAVAEHLTRMHQAGVPAALEAHLAEAAV